MLKKVFAPVLRFFTLIASALAGISAVCTAVGFLAHRAHLNMLGVSNIPVDLNQYMYTGAQFLAYLPFKLISIIALNILDLGRTYFLEFSVTLVVLFIMYWLLRFRLVRQFSQEFLNDIKNFIRHHRSTLWLVILIGQFIAVHQLLKASRITSLLFGDNIPAPPSQSIEFPLWADEGVLAFWISTNESGELLQFLGWLALIIIITAVILWKMIGTYRKIELRMSRFWQTFWLGVNLMLFCTQIILFPINYGILLLSNEYPQVEVVVDDSLRGNPLWQGDERLILIDSQNGKFYFYSRSERRLWYIKDSDIHSISYFGMVDIFESADQADLREN
ncbi:hypothetical protein NC796_13805 [Aliifodinibius sp. S!AR15-10]|uniref:hypothetical protein n=1 Tax=Aliifodinibius sp. S!AR15-10 TaxID=2950437 RepID=UPI002854EFC3|nr:hypothetical protein [Aliifodinibius sp. S!AR15-10]MDR8392223.1 hypothetical protein [Aliifodinibius sp. S!AR15-10]